MAVVLVEPLLSPQGPTALDRLKTRLVKSAQQRRDIWPTRKHASSYFSSNRHLARWHPDVLNLYVVRVDVLIVSDGSSTHSHQNFGLTTLSGVLRGVATHGGVTLACSREEEIVSYLGHRG